MDTKKFRFFLDKVKKGKLSFSDIESMLTVIDLIEAELDEEYVRTLVENNIFWNIVCWLLQNDKEIPLNCKAFHIIVHIETYHFFRESMFIEDKLDTEYTFQQVTQTFLFCTRYPMLQNKWNEIAEENHICGQWMFIPAGVFPYGIEDWKYFLDLVYS